MNQNPNDYSSLLNRILNRDNLILALKQVQRNKGGPGVDGMTVDELSDFLKHHWLAIRRKIELGQYIPKPVKRVEIPKPDGRKRHLGIPTVLDRFIQQAISQVLQTEWEPTFHNNSYGFRPHRNAHQAIRHVQKNVRKGYSWMIDCDLEAFFDQVNHDHLMQKLKTRHQEPMLLLIINRYLKAGIQINDTTVKSLRGVPQGGPLSPLLSNIVLTDLDWELDRQQHPFARYADDFVVLVKSRRAGMRVMKRLQCFINDSLKLKVNASKSAVDKPWNRTFLGFTLSRNDKRIKVSDKAIRKLKVTIKQLSRRTRGHSLRQVIAELRKFLLGWKAYFDIAEVVSPLRDLDKWIRRRLRSYCWKQWGRSGYRRLIALGIDRFLAWNTSKSAHGPWRLSRSPALYKGLPNKYFMNLGLPELAAR